ncbi:MAG: lamin tail domain-containing protein, partial [Opitutales bacterium]|nr:lamin tail domain-containing protein [Opitutales bacterium]
VRITEFMAVNSTVLADQSGAFPDWIELQNSSMTTIDLSSWSLTDDAKIPSLWKFPDGTTLAAGARLIVFASGLSPSPAGELHASFKLTGSAGGFLALTNPSGEIVQVFHDYPGQREDFSYGLANDGGLVRFFDQPTPTQLNGNGILGFVKDTKFSHDRGFHDRPFDLSISTDTGGTKIYYTIDGSKPSAQNGTLYANSISISNTTTLRAIAVKSGHVPTNIDTHTYLFTSGIISQPATPSGFPSTWNGHAADYGMDPEIVSDPRWRNDIQSDLKTIPSLSLVLNRDDMFNAQTGIYPKGESVEKATSVELIYPNGDKGFQIDGSVQIVGGSSVNRWKSEKLSMRLKFTSSYGPPSLKFPVFGDHAAQEFETLVVDARLNNVWSYGGGVGGSGQRQRGQYLRDQYAADLQRKLGGDSPHGFNIHLYIDGLYWGIHTLHERPDENFVHQYRGGRPDDYDVIKHRTSTVVHGTNASYQALVNAANQNLAIDVNYEKVKQMMAIEPFIEYMLVNFYLGNTDWGHQNWYASTHRTDPSRNWRFHSWDAEHVMESLSQNAVSRNNNGGPTRIHQQLKLNPEYKTLFIDLVYRHLYNDGILSPENAAAHYRYKATFIERAIIAESARWGDNQRTAPYTEEDWIKERDNLLNNYFPQRRDIVIQQLRGNQAYPSIDPPAFAQRGGEVAAGFKLSLTVTKGDIYYTLDGSDPRIKGGAISGIASKYSTAIPLASPSALVRARVRFGNEWSAIDEATFIVEPVKPTSATLAITEILYEPTFATAQEKADGFEAADFEFIELRNLDKTKPVNLAGLKFTSGVEFTFSSGLVLDPGERTLLLANRRAFESRNGSTASIVGEFQGKLSNSGETLRLIASDGTVVQSFSYDNSAGWPAGAGNSIVLVDPESQPDPGDPSSWKASRDIGGSPGEEESSSGSDVDTDGLPDDWEITHFGNLGQPHDGDFDKDGINNLLEFAFGSAPSDPNSRNLPFSGLSADGYFTLSWSRPEAAANLIFTVEVSEDLKTWASGKTALVNSTTENGITTTTIRDTQPHATSSLRLLRLVISTP